MALNRLYTHRPKGSRGPLYCSSFCSLLCAHCSPQPIPFEQQICSHFHAHFPFSHAVVWYDKYKSCFLSLKKRGKNSFNEANVFWHLAEESVAIFNTLGCVCPVSCAPFQVVVVMSVYKRTRLAHSLKNRYLNSENSLSFFYAVESV